ncbi:MAG: glycosyltransferase [Cyclonatronaceae bacterium]
MTVLFDIIAAGSLLLQLVCTAYLLLPLLYNAAALLFAMPPEEVVKASAGAQPAAAAPAEAGFACVITAYKEKEFAFLLVDSLLKQQYENYHIYVVADRCSPAEEDLQHDKLTLIYPEKPLDSKVQSLLTALQQIPAETLPYTLVFDPDNLGHPQLLSEMNYFAQLGFQAIQARRTAKNLNTAYACLDAASETYYHISQRLAPFRLGSSATIAGSGMAINTQLYKQLLEKTIRQFAEGEVIVAEDKILQNELIKAEYIIAYASRGLVYDEKVASGAQIQRQRTRWINSWFGYFREALGLAGFGLRRLSSNAFLFGLMISTPPLFLLGLAGLLLSVLSWFITPAFAPYMSGATLLFLLNFIASLAAARADFRIWKALGLIPWFVLRQVMAMLNLRQANTSFMETAHEKKLNIDQVLHEFGTKT